MCGTNYSQDGLEIGYKRAMGVIQLHKLYGADRLNNACKRALQADVVGYRRIENILKNKLDQSTLFMQEEGQEQSHIPKHQNIRGASNYQ